ncbi:hypothetical protein MBLNU230_g5163t1 [Neophaeotheca triangularis]
MAYETPSMEHVHRSTEFNFRTPTPPRIIVPPPTLNSDAIPEITLKALGWENRNFVHSNALLEWSYERRREAQMILPYLYLGPMSAAKDGNFLTREGITMVLGIKQKHGLGAKLMQNAMLKAQELGIQYAAFEVGSDQELAQTFASTTQTINDHIMQKRIGAGKTAGKVLVFCESGNERSAAVAAAYLMETHDDVDFIKAIQLCQAQRFCTNFDDKIKVLLQARWTFIVAQRQVAKNGGAKEGLEGNVRSEDSGSDVHTDDGLGHGMANLAVDVSMKQEGTKEVKQKRELERDEEDEDMDDKERFGGRQFVPFEDAPSPGSNLPIAADATSADVLSAGVASTGVTSTGIDSTNTTPADTTPADVEME